MKSLLIALAGVLSIASSASAAQQCKVVMANLVNPYVISSEASIITKGKEYPCKVELYYFAEYGFKVRCANGYLITPLLGGYGRQDQEYGLVSFNGKDYKMASSMSRQPKEFFMEECKKNYALWKITTVLSQASFDVLLRMKFKIATY